MTLAGVFLRTAAMAAFYTAGMFGGHYLLGMFGFGLAVFSMACCALVLPAQLAFYAVSDSRRYRKHVNRTRATGESVGQTHGVCPCPTCQAGVYVKRRRAELKAQP